MGFFFFSFHHKWENVNALFHFHMLGVWTNAPSAKRILGPHLLSGLVKRGFIWLIWMSVLSSDRSCSLWSSGSSPSIFLAYVSCFLCRSEWPQFIVSYRWRTQFEIRYHSLSGFCWFVCSTCSYIPFSAGQGVFFFLGAPSVTAVNKDYNVERSSSYHIVQLLNKGILNFLDSLEQCVWSLMLWDSVVVFR